MATDNNKVISDGLVKAKRIIDERITSALSKTAFDLIDETDAPIWTHNLWDSIGCGIYKDGALIKVVYPPKRAEEPRSDIYGIAVPNRDYWGYEELRDMIMNPPSSIPSKGWALYYVAAMPYSEIVDNRSDVDVLHEEVVKPKFLSHIKIV